MGTSDSNRPSTPWICLIPIVTSASSRNCCAHSKRQLLLERRVTVDLNAPPAGSRTHQHGWGGCWGRRQERWEQQHCLQCFVWLTRLEAEIHPKKKTERRKDFHDTMRLSGSLLTTVIDIFLTNEKQVSWIQISGGILTIIINPSIFIFLDFHGWLIPVLVKLVLTFPVWLRPHGPKKQISWYLRLEPTNICFKCNH